MIDLIVGRREGKGIKICLNAGNRKFAQPVPLGSTEREPYAVAVADLNRNGIHDVVVGYRERVGPRSFSAMVPHRTLSKQLGTTEWELFMESRLVILIEMVGRILSQQGLAALMPFGSTSRYRPSTNEFSSPMFDVARYKVQAQ